MKDYLEQCQIVRKLTIAPMNKILAALIDTKGDVDKAVELLTKEMSKVDVTEMANRTADVTIVYSYVHNYRIGAMLVLACQTDFATKNTVFLELAKDICIHIVSTPIPPTYVSEFEIPGTVKSIFVSDAKNGLENKPPQVVEKIVDGKLKKFLGEICLLNQPFVKDDKITVEQLIAKTSATLGEKIEIKRFFRTVAS